MDELKAIQPKQAWVTESDQSVVIVSGPQVVGDTLVGYVKGVYEEMPSAQLKEVRVEKPATTKTALLVGAITVGFAGMVYALAGSGRAGRGRATRATSIRTIPSAFEVDPASGHQPAPVETAVLNRLAHVFGREIDRPIQIGDGAGDLEDPVVGAS